MKTSRTIATLLVAVSISLCASISTDAQNRKKESDEGKAVVELTSETFKTTICDITDKDASFLGDKPAIVDFTATWCGPCRSIAPILEELAKEYESQIVVYKVDVDNCRDVATAFGISSIPAVLYIPLDGEPSMTIGARNKSKFQSEIDKILLGK